MNYISYNDVEYAIEYLLQNVYKLLKVNLTTDTFETIRVDEDELTDEKGYVSTSISGWLNAFADSGQIYSDDVAAYKMHTNINFLRRFFSFTDAIFRIRYRRLVGDDYRFVMMEMIPAKEFSEDNMVVILSIRDIDEDIIEMLEATKREEMAEQINAQYSTLLAVSGIYHSMHVIDILEDTIYQFKTGESAHYYANHQPHAAERLRKDVLTTVIKDDINRFEEFINLETLASRLKDTNSISAEFVDTNHGWFRAQFIANSYTADHELASVVFTIQIIEAEKRREENLIRISNTDEMTHLYNRRCYDMDSEEYKHSSMEDDLVVVLMDLNRLKYANDTFGHAAGDELITSAASCMITAFGHIGRVYRTGGDEFAAILHVDASMVPSYIEALNELTSKWHGKYMDSMSIASGYAAHSEHLDMSYDELEKLADELMYENKSTFYKESNIDRRRR